MNGVCKTDAYVVRTGFGLRTTLNQMNTKKYIRN